MKMTAPMEVGICCESLDRLAAFYTGVLGMKMVNTIEVPAEKAAQASLSAGSYRVARLQTGWGERIKLLEPSRVPDPREPLTPSILDRAGTAYLTFIVPDLTATVARLIEAGIEMTTGNAPVEVREGTFLAFGRDPEGNILEFVQYRDVTAYRDDLPSPAGTAS